MKRTLFFVLTLIPFCLSLYGQTIAEKKKGLVRGVTDLEPQMEAALIKVNRELEEKKAFLSDLYAEVYKLHELQAPEESFEEILLLINETRWEIKELDSSWQQLASQSSKTDLYALWHQPDSTIEQLVMDYGAQDYVYVMPPDIAEMRISVNSNIPIPKASWESMLDMILSQNGIGIHQLNPYLRELYKIEGASAPVSLITDKPDELAFLPPEQRIAFIIAPDPSDVKRTWTFLNKFINPKTTIIEQIGREILVVSQVSDIQDLLKLYDFVASGRSQKQYKLVPLTKIKAQEMAKVLSAMFDHMVGDAEIYETEGGQPSKPRNEEVVNGLKIIVLESLSQAVFLVGTPEEIQMAEQMIQRIECKIGGGRENVVYWYRTKHSTAQDLANILQQVYTTMMIQRIGLVRPQPGLPPVANQNVDQNITLNEINRPLEPFPIFDNNYYGEEPVITAPVIDPGLEVNEPTPKPRQNPNFIVDDKTGSIIMVVEEELLPRLMEIVTKLDVPKKMVQIDVLVFERGTRERTDYGLNLLKVGGCADNKRLTCIDWNPTALGLFQFLFSRPKTGNGPAFDLIYRFLLTQENLTVNANPSVVAINQTPAEISIRDEISISTGVNFISTPDANANTPRESFVREQYGITIKVTPTVHLWREDEEIFDEDVDFVSLETYINFDTIQRTTDTTANSRPDVLRRELKNEALVADGQTIVMGGLRRKISDDRKQSIPFFGEIPGFGKLFSMTEMEDTTTELIIFMTPKIIIDPCEDIERIKFKKLRERPGDLPCFLCRLNESQEQYQRRAFAHTLKILCGNPRDHYYPTQIGCYPASMRRGGYCSCGEYDGR